MLCPHCHQEISAGSKFCNFCGKPIPQEVFCAKCGAKLPQGSRFCHLCGEAVNAVPAPDAEEEKRAAAEREGQARLREALHALDAEEQTLRQQMEQARAARQEVDAARTALHEESGVPAKPQNEPAPAAIHKKPVEKTVRPPRRRPVWLVPAAAGVAVLAVAAVVLTMVFGKSENVKALEAQIASIGTVALDDRERIETAEKMQAALKPSELKKVGNLQELEEALNEYRETIGLYFGRIDDPELEILFHREAPLRVLMSSTHALCEKAALRMEDLRGCKVILVNSDPEVMRQLQNRLESVGCPPQIMLDGAEWEQAVELIQSAGYISFCLPPGNLSNARLQTREIEDLGLTLDFNMAVMRGVAMTDAERRFVEYVVQMMTANHGGDEAKKR